MSLIDILIENFSTISKKINEITIDEDAFQKLYLLNKWIEIQSISAEITDTIDKLRLSPGFANTMIPGPHYECVILINTVFNMFLLDKDNYGSVVSLNKMMEDYYKLSEVVYKYDEDALFLEKAYVSKHLFIIKKFIHLLKSNVSLILDTLNINKIALISWLKDCHKKTNSTYHH